MTNPRHYLYLMGIYLAVVDFLAGQGIPEKRMAAAGFSKFHPLDPADTAEAYRRNRRIEIKLTER